MIEKQGGLCAICRERPATHVDHDHDTGKIRGILCRQCNAAIGTLGDTADSLMRAVRYLKGNT